MKFQTKISSEKNGKHHIRGIPLLDLIEKHTFVDMIFLLVRGTMPSGAEKALLDAVLVASVEHGVQVPSAFVPRISISTGNSIHTALASGILATGTRHGGAGEAAAEFLLEKGSPQKIVKKALKEHRVISGFGHKVYKDEDPRVTVLYKRVQKLGLPVEMFARAYACEAEIAKQKGKKLPLNIDGGIAAALLTLKFRSDAGHAIFLFGRIVGMAAHALEERTQNNAYYRLDDSDVLR